MLRPLSGKIIVNGTNLTRLKSKEADKFRGKEIGIIFQKPYFTQWLTASENLRIGKYLTNLPPEKEYIKINRDDPYHLMYMLTDAELVKIIK